jgi:hypothetical protein
VADGRFDAARGTADDPAAVIDTDPATLAEVLWHGGRQSALATEGDKSAVKRFLRLFPPPTAAPPRSP